MRKLLSLGVTLGLALSLKAQIVAGPMLGQVELRDARVWVEVAPTVKSIQLLYNKKGEPAKAITIAYKGELGNEFNPVQFTVGGLDLNTTYQYRFVVDGKPAKQGGEFTTKDLWQWRKPAPDFTFLTGSCAYFNEPAYDRPGKPYGGDSSIFITMSREKAAFMLWLGDNWYTREVDYFSKWGLWYRAHQTRRQPVLQPLFKAMPNYATWDDHDYGPNDIGKHFILKEESKKVFDSYWANPSSGHNGQGIYTQLSYGDVDIFLTDGRWWRSTAEVPSVVNGHPNPEKRMFGELQLEWLKNALLYSQATFKIIVVGSQVLNPPSTKDKLLDFPADYNALTQFLEEEKVNGVLFMSGDRHHSEIIKVDRPATYPLYDITVSSLTAGTVGFTGTEKDNPYRLLGIDKNNYGRISVSGPKGQRKLLVEYLGVKGEKLGEWGIGESGLKTPNQK
jgi:alkaline phosphatase D